MKRHYFTPKDNVVTSFFVPLLETSTQYDHATGYFSAKALASVTVGLKSLIKNGGKIRIITSPRLTTEDIEKIRQGYDLRKVIDQSMLRDFDDDYFQVKERLSLIAYLIAIKRAEIKIAVMKNYEDSSNGMFHPKFGAIYSAEGDIAFTGSGNFTPGGLYYNWDELTTIDSLIDPAGFDELKESFELLWDNTDEYAETLDLTEAVAEKIKSYYRNDDSLYDLDKILLEEFGKNTSEKRSFLKCPEYITPKPHQTNAVEKWVNSQYRGIFNMATGAGKTIAALCALEKLYQKENNVFTIIVCPQIHLVDQWVENVNVFGVEPIIAYSAYKNWKSAFKSYALNKKQTNGCMVITNQSFIQPDIQKFISTIENLAIVIDEAHNMGSEVGIKSLPNNAKYRLALSATIDRFRDPHGTKILRDYFGPECGTYTIDEAIEDGVLTHYNYHPIPCTMTPEEYQKFVETNNAIETILNSDIKESTKRTLIRPYRLAGAQLVARLHSKYETLQKYGLEHKNDDHILIYCGKARWKNSEEKDENEQEECLRLIEKATTILGHFGVGMNLSKFTCDEKPRERQSIKKQFELGKTQAIVAISCLDEGVDIPSIRTAILTASGENPKEYIQRRGRVLRTFKGKEIAEIYDYIAIPKPLECSNGYNTSAALEIKFLVKEIKRMLEFSRLSSNKDETLRLLNEISSSYQMSIDQMIDEYSEVITYDF